MIRESAGSVESVTECSIGCHITAIKNPGVAGHMVCGGVIVGPCDGGSRADRKSHRRKIEIDDVDSITRSRCS